MFDFEFARKNLNPGACEALIPVLEWLEAGAPHKKVEKKKIGFNMNHFFNTRADTHLTKDFAKIDCGTVCCIAGAISLFSEDYRIFSLNHQNTGRSAMSCIFDIAEKLGMSEKDADELFYLVNFRDVGLEYITPSQAAKVLRHYMNTGKVAWEAYVHVSELQE